MNDAVKFECGPSVMPAKAGIQQTSELQRRKDWVPACAGTTTFFQRRSQ